MTAASLAPLLQAFFTHRLLQERSASSHTIAGYRDTFRLLLRFAAKQLDTAPSDPMCSATQQPWTCSNMGSTEP